MTRRDTTHRSQMGRTIDEDSLAFAMKPHPFQPNPKKSGLYSAILPGLGQAYNRQYWKIPVVYGGIGIATYFVVTNLNKYRTYRSAYILHIADPNINDIYTKEYGGDPTTVIAQLKQLQDDADKYLNLTVLFSGIGYFMQVVDAITGAHLKNFDISRDISMHVAPAVYPNGFGLGVSMCFK